MADNEVTIVCANLDCRVAQTDRCVEGHELDACPYYGRTTEDGESDLRAAEQQEADEGVRLPAAGTLTLAEASAVLRSGDTRVVVVIGPSDSGKTSLIASVYDEFQEGPLGDIEFSRSRTLHAFEQTCHDARAASRRSVPEMNRTPIGDVHFYHLEISGGGAGDRLELLLGDRAGEEYPAAADDVTAVAGFAEMPRADTLTMLVDGERLIDAGARHNLRSDVTMTLQALHDGGGLRAGARLALVLTKLDAVKIADHAARAHRDFATLLADLKRLFGEALAEIEGFKTAAYPKTDVVPRGTGVPELLRFWLKAAAPAHAPMPVRPSFGRAFARLKPVEEPMEELHG